MYYESSDSDFEEISDEKFVELDPVEEAEIKAYHEKIRAARAAAGPAGDEEFSDGREDNEGYYGDVQGCLEEIDAADLISEGETDSCSDDISDDGRERVDGEQDDEDGEMDDEQEEEQEEEMDDAEVEDENADGDDEDEGENELF